MLVPVLALWRIQSLSQHSALTDIPIMFRWQNDKTFHSFSLVQYERV